MANHLICACASALLKGLVMVIARLDIALLRQFTIDCCKFVSICSVGPSVFSELTTVSISIQYNVVPSIGGSVELCFGFQLAAGACGGIFFVSTVQGLTYR
jgi:hypothetical protein